MSNKDPGGEEGTSSERPNIANLQESFSKQQAKISALKELVRKSEAAHGKSTSSAQEKVKNIAQRLTHLKSKARSRQNLDRSFSEFRDEIILEESNPSVDLHSQSTSDISITVSSNIRSRSETPGSEKIQLLRQQMEQNKIKMAEREHSKREIEEQLVQLRAKFDSTQQSLERSSELGRSMSDLSALSAAPMRDKFKSASDLSFTPLNLNKERIKFLENRISILEKQLDKSKNIREDDNPPDRIKYLENKILDLEESLKEKECVIEARTAAVSLMSKSLSAKGKNTVDMLEDTKQEMFKMQTDFIEKEDTFKSEIQQLKDELDEKTRKILNLEEINDILETARFDLTIKNAELEGKIEDVQDYSTKLSELNKLNENLQHRIADLENQKYEFVEGEELDVAKQVGVEYANNMQNLQDRIKELEIENDNLKKLAQDSQMSPSAEMSDKDVAEQIKSLEAMIEMQREDIEKQLLKIKELEEQVAEKTIEYNVLNANFSVLQEKLKASAPKSLFSKSSDEEAEAEINKYKSKMDEANKSMIKMKLKTKQLQKQIDSFKKISDVHNEVIRLTEEIQQLQQKVTELEDEKGSLQLKLVNCDTSGLSDTELEKNLQILEATCQNQTSAIQLLEEQKLDMTENLQTTKQELESLKNQMNEIDREETAKVVSHMESVKLEEQFEDCLTQITDFKDEIKKYQEGNEHLREELKQLEQERNELNKKIDHYVTENMELLDKIEKLSKPSSSAESIEIVERLTHQEQLEIEAFNKRLEEENVPETPSVSNIQIADDGDGAIGEELSESLVKLREESSELMDKIELFTTERREVLEKMEILSNENQEHMRKIAKLSDEKVDIEEKYNALKEEKMNMEDKLANAIREKNELSQDIKELNENRSKLQEELNILLKEKNSVKNIEPTVSAIVCTKEDYDSCEQCLNRLNTELDNYRKSNDKNSRINTSKKLAKEAKNVYQLMLEFINKLKQGQENNLKPVIDESSYIEEIKQKHTDLQIMVDNLQHELIELKLNCKEKDEKILELNSEIITLTEVSENAKQLINEKGNIQRQTTANLEALRKDLEMKLTTSENEIDILKTLVAEQKQQLIESFTEQETELSDKIEQIKQYENEIQSLKNALSKAQKDKSESYDSYVDQLQVEISKLQVICSENKILLDEQSKDLLHKQETIETLNAQIMDLYKTMESNSNALIEKEDEINNLQDTLNKNKIHYSKLHKESEENKRVIDKLLIELHTNNKKYDILESLVGDKTQSKNLQSRVKELEKLNSDLENKNKDQLDKLKKFAANLKKKVAQCNELEAQLKMVQKGNQLETTIDSNRIVELENELKSYQNEFSVMKSSLNQHIINLQKDLDHLNNENQILKTEKSENIMILGNIQNELSFNRNEIHELRNSHNVLQILSQDLQLENQRKEEQLGTLQNQIQLLVVQIQERDQELKINSENLNIKNLKFEKSKAMIKEKIRKIQRLTTENDDLKMKVQRFTEKVEENVTSTSNIEQDYIKLKEEYKNLVETYESEKSTFQETISRLETLHDGIQAKLQEDMGYIESLETENNKFKEKICKLEDCVATFEDRRSSLERQSNLLEGQLRKRTDEYEKNEDALIYRLNMLSEHDDVIGRRLLETQEENEELAEKLDRLKAEHSELIMKFSKIEKEYETFKHEKYEILESENQSIHEQLNTMKIEMGKMQSNYELKLYDKNAEIDVLENDLSIQLQAVNIEKRSLQENLEKSIDEINDLKDDNIKLKESNNSLEQNKNDLEREITWLRMQNENLTQDQFELQELRMQIIQDKTEIENQKHQLDTLIQNHEIELNALRTQISELDSMRMQVSQNQTDDQVFIETENKRLKELVTEKEAAIENYQRQNLQLQMGSLTSISTDPFATLPNNQEQNTEIIALREKVTHLESELTRFRKLFSDKDDHFNNTVKEINILKQELNQLTLNNTELQKLNFEKQNEITTLKTELEWCHRKQNETVTPLYSDQSITVFDEEIPIKIIEPLGVEQQDLKKIEDLERNVSDLEKYVTDLENKLKNLTHVHEQTLIQARQYETSVKQFQNKIKELEEKEKEKEIEIQKTVDNQILPQANIPSLNMFFDSNPQEVSVDFDQIVNKSNLTEAIPVVEEIIVPKKAYICHPETEQVPELNEGWGWGSEEAALEEKHQTSTISENYSLVSADQKFEIQLQEYQDRVKELELERNRLEEKVVELQVKSGKMMKKLKEYKASNDNLQKTLKKSPSMESNDLDLAIQEELKSQVKQVEDKYDELKKQHSKDLAEKENLLKRIDVLTSANDRMMEMKERQDVEIQMSQSQVRRLNDQIKTLEDWVYEKPDKVSTAPMQSNQTEISASTEHDNNLQMQLTETMKELEDLKIDRDELQELLDEEKENVRLSENKIKELEIKIISIENETLEDDNNSEFQLQSLRSEIIGKATELSNMKLQNQNLHLQLSDYQSTIEQLSTESNSIKLHLDELRNEHQKKLDENTNLTKELQSWVDRSNELSNEIEAMRCDTKSSAATIENNNELEHRIQELNAQLQYKDAEILHLKQKVEDVIREDQTQSLVQEILGKNHEINTLKQHVQALETEKLELENNLSIQLTKEMNQKILENNPDSNLTEKISDLEKTVQDLKLEKMNMESELEVLNNHVLSSLEMEDKMKQNVLELDMKTIEIAELKKSLDILKQQQQDASSTKSVNTDRQDDNIQQINAQWELIVEQKCGQVAESWRQHLAQKELEFKDNEDKLNLKIEQLQQIPSNQSIVVSESDNQSIATDQTQLNAETFQNMQSALETQELEIVTLKEQLAMRSAEYARLAAQHDPYGQTSSSLQFTRKISNDQTTSVVPKSELDLALYMLHQRDMRTEEITLELVNLLEERDTLQLKLSNAIRQVEDIKRKTGYSESGTESDQSPSDTNSPEKVRTKSTGTIFEDDSIKSSNQLNEKLSQLHSVGHSRDKRIWEDKEQRQRQMEKIQQDIANIPSEAVSELVGTDMTNTTQSPSSVLLNWLWGKSNTTPPQQS